MSNLLLSAVFVPIIGAFFLPLIGRVSKTIRNYSAFLLMMISVIGSLGLLPIALAGQSFKYLVFVVDPLSIYMALISSFIGLIIVLFSFDYISHYDNQNEYYLMVVLFLGSMMGLVYSRHLIALYLFWEITALACWRLIGFFRKTKDILRADKAFLVTFAGAVVMLLGFIGIFQLYGTFDLTVLMGKPIPDILVWLILCGILSKSATLPFHTWLPDAGVAPSPVTALLHAAVLVKIGVYVFARLFVVTFMISPIWHTILPAVAAASALIAAGAALVETDLKRIIAYSTVSQIGFIFLGLASGNPIGISGGLLYILMHGLAKGGLFLCAGIIEQNTGTKDITKMGGLVRSMPVTALSFLLCSFSVMGLPPFGGFFSKFLVITGSAQTVNLWIVFAFLTGAFLTIIYLFRVFSLIFLGEPRGIPVKEGSRLMLFCVGFLAFLSLVTGFVLIPWSNAGILSLFRFDHFGTLMATLILIFAGLIGFYSCSFMKGKEGTGQFYFYLILTALFACGAVLANNLVIFLFFWEGLLITLFGLIYIGGRNSFQTAIKATVIIGVTDLCLMLGIGLIAKLSGTLMMSQISLPLGGLGSLAFILLMIGAIAKAGSMPFHTWIPDAATDAPLPFMALLPGALEKLLGIYFLTRITLEIFKLDPHSWVSSLLMIIGGLTIILAVLMALIQKDFKKLLSYHAISQVGYMILGIGTALPIGIIGGLFHMVNNALYKSCLFLTGGAVEKQTGTTDLRKLGGLGWRMPVTFGCFIIAALSISGVPPFNGFFSKELIYDAALERGLIFYLLAAGGSFFTAASFLKLGHAAFLGEKGEQSGGVKEVSWVMLLPMILIALTCIVFGINNAYPLNQLISPAVALAGHEVAGWPANTLLVIITGVVLSGAIANHYYGVRKTGQGLGAVDHLHYAPVMHQTYDLAERKVFDPYEQGMKVIGFAANILNWLDRVVDGLYERVVVRLTESASWLIHQAHTGNVSLYVLWSMIGALVVIIWTISF
jgi:NADH-quinone oxidoreductase subunit L